MPVYRLTATGRAVLRAVLDADQLDRTPAGYQAPGSNVGVDLSDGWVEPVKPPLPPEPGDGLVVHVGTPPFVFKRCGDTMHQGEVTGRWYRPGVNAWTTWERVCGYGIPVLLVPAADPADDQPSAEDWAAARKVARVHGFAGGTEVNSVSFTAGFAVGYRKGRRFPEREPVAVPWDGVSVRGRSVVDALSDHDKWLYSPVEARAKAYALLSAADQAERRAAS